MIPFHEKMCGAKFMQNHRSVIVHGQRSIAEFTPLLGLQFACHRILSCLISGSSKTGCCIACPLSPLHHQSTLTPPNRFIADLRYLFQIVFGDTMRRSCSNRGPSRSILMLLITANVGGPVSGVGNIVVCNGLRLQHPGSSLSTLPKPHANLEQ